MHSAFGRLSEENGTVMSFEESGGTERLSIIPDSISLPFAVTVHLRSNSERSVNKCLFLTVNSFFLRSFSITFISA